MKEDNKKIFKNTNTYMKHQLGFFFFIALICSLPALGFDKKGELYINTENQLIINEAIFDIPNQNRFEKIKISTTDHLTFWIMAKVDNPDGEKKGSQINFYKIILNENLKMEEYRFLFKIQTIWIKDAENRIIISNHNFRYELIEDESLYDFSFAINRDRVFDGYWFEGLSFKYLSNSYPFSTFNMRTLEVVSDGGNRSERRVSAIYRKRDLVYMFSYFNLKIYSLESSLGIKSEIEPRDIELSVLNPVYQTDSLIWTKNLPYEINPVEMLSDHEMLYFRESSIGKDFYILDFSNDSSYMIKESVMDLVIW